MSERENTVGLTLITEERKLVEVTVGFSEFQKIVTSSRRALLAGEPLVYRFHDDPRGRIFETRIILMTVCSAVTTPGDLPTPGI